MHNKTSKGTLLLMLLHLKIHFRNNKVSPQLKQDILAISTAQRLANNSNTLYISILHKRCITIVATR